MVYRILSIDGGGTRGVYAARLLERLTTAFGKSVVASADLLAGTSTGALLALGFAVKKTPTQMRKLYEDNADEIFDDSWVDNIKDFGQLIGAQYDDKKKRKIFEGQFGKTTKLKDLKQNVLVPTFQLDARVGAKKVRTSKPKFFHNFLTKDGQKDLDVKVVDVAMRTSAAPTFFPTYQGFIDGGVVANNPSMAAVAQALSSQGANKPLAEIRMLSIGTGLVPQYIEGDHDWGLAQWAKPLVNIMIDGGMGVADYQCDQLLGARYMRVVDFLPKEIPLDSLDLKTLVAAADDVDLDEAEDWLANWWV